MFAYQQSYLVVRTGFEPVQSDAVRYLPSRTPSALKSLRLPISPPDYLRVEFPLCCEPALQPQFEFLHIPFSREQHNYFDSTIRYVPSIKPNEDSSLNS